MAIQLLIKGNVAQAIKAAHDRGISLNQTHLRAPSYGHFVNETHARCASDYRANVVAWFAEDPRHSPYPIGTLLLFSDL